MPSYDVITEFDLSKDKDAISVDPYWVVAVVRFENPVTYSRHSGESFSKLYADGVKVRGKPLIITDDCLQVSTTATKNSHVSQMNATLLPSENYLSEIFPGDWLFVWMVHDRGSFNAVIEALQNGKSANEWKSGLKFMGRVQGIRKVITQEAGIGVRATRYTLTGAGFTEFDATLYYNPYLAAKVPALGQHWARIGANLNKLIKDNGQGIGVTQALTFFLDLLMGQGVPQNLNRGNADPRLRSTAGLDAPYSYSVPSVVGQILGIEHKSKDGDIMGYADILEFVYGVQKYSNLSTSQGAAVARIFNPEGTGPGNRRYTGKDMMGTFIPTTPNFTNTSVWTILNQYLNSSVNEMYTCLRVNPDGRVMPTLVARQLPFTSELGPDIPVTFFHELPRWKLDPILIKRADIGRSDVQRINFVHVYGDSGRGKPSEMTGQVVRYPPKRDDLDIARNGFRPFMKTVACAEKDIHLGDPEKWMALLADIMMGQHMTMNGLVELVGIQAPICPGDNVEFDDVVLHIESVTHTAGIDGAGFKNFSTTLALSYGVAAEPKGGNLGLYATTRPEETRALEAGITTEREADPNGGPGTGPREAGTKLEDRGGLLSALRKGLS